MRTRLHTALAALTATLIFALALTANASARSFSVSEKEFEVLFKPLEFVAAGNTMRCPITLLGHFNERTIAKVAGQVGVIRHVEPTTSGEPSPCTGGTLTILTETLPWRLNYVGFTGRLPAIERVRLSLVGIAFRITFRGSLTCLAGTTAREPAFGEVAVGTGGRVENLRLDETRTIRLGGGFLCELAGESHFAGTGTVLNLPGTASVTVTLI
jgi:hypothetical protein